MGAGEFVAVVGPSGCGKSTLLNIAGVMLSPDSGSLSICGEGVSKLPRRAWTALRKEIIGFIFQSHQLLPYLKAGEQLMSLLGTSEEVARELFKELDIEGTAWQSRARSRPTPNSSSRTSPRRRLTRDAAGEPWR